MANLNELLNNELRELDDYAADEGEGNFSADGYEVRALIDVAQAAAFFEPMARAKEILFDNNSLQLALRRLETYLGQKDHRL